MQDSPSPSAADGAPRRPTWSFVLAHPAHFLGLGAGSGLSPKAPGTAGTLWAWAVWVLLQAAGLSPVWGGVLIVVSIPVGWWACTVSARDLRMSDPGCVVWDEVAAFWLMLWVLEIVWAPAPWSRAAWLWQLAAFASFRFFDAVKPQPVHWADQVFKGGGWRGGWGIMWDDLVAAACALAVLAVGHAFLPR